MDQNSYINLHVGITRGYTSLCIWTPDKLQFLCLVLIAEFAIETNFWNYIHACSLRFQHFAEHFQRQQEEEMKHCGYVAAKEVGNITQWGS